MGGAGRCCLTGLALRGGEFGGGSAFIVGAGRGARALLDLSRSSRHVAYWRDITGFLRHAHTWRWQGRAKRERACARGAPILMSLGGSRGEEVMRGWGGDVMA